MKDKIFLSTVLFIVLSGSLAFGQKLDDFKYNATPRSCKLCR